MAGRAAVQFLLGWTPGAGQTAARADGRAWRLEAEGAVWWLLGEAERYGEATGSDAVLGAFAAEAAEGNERAERLCGNCAVVRRDAAGAWTVWTNLAGSLHLYHLDDGARRGLSTKGGLLYGKTEKKLDWEGLAGFFGLGFFPGDRTYVPAVKILRPATRYAFGPEGRLLRAERYWQWRHEPDRRRGEAETIAGFGARLRAVLEDETRDGRAALPLSGGLDSRTVAACLPDGAGIRSYGYGYTEDSIEIRIAKKVAEAVGLPFHGHVIRPYLFERMEEVAEATECFQDLTQARQADVSEWLAAEADFVLAAHWGDVFCDDMGFAGARGTEEEVLEHSLKKMQKKGRQWLLEQVVRPHLGQDPEEAVREAVRAELRRLPEIEDPDFRVKVLKTEQWAFRWTLASLRAYQLGAFPRIPFLDPRMVEFFCTVPTEMVRGRRLEIEYLKRHAPRVARIEWQPYEANLYTYRWSPLWMKPVRAWRKLRRTVRGEKAIQRNWEVQFFSVGGWEQLEGWLLRKGLVLHELVTSAKIRDLLEEFRRSPDGANGYAVSMLLTFSVWLERWHGATV